MKFILVYKNPEDNKLTVFETESEAAFQSEEWVSIEANNLQEAESKYEQSFEEWKNNNS